MSRVLVIKDVNFYSNRVANINFTDIPCTGIILDKNTVSVAETETVVLTATKTPSNTTDVVRWFSSDENIATVNGGAITAVARGTARITARCGEYIATCDITVTSPEIFARTKYVVPAIHSNELTGWASLAGAPGSRGISIGYSIGGQYPALGDSSSSGLDDYLALYPYPIPEGATKIRIACQNFGIILTYFDSTSQAAIPSSTKIRDAALVVDGETPTAGTDWSIPGWTYDTRTVEIPDISGLDSFIVSLYGKTADAYDNFDLSDITIEFLYD